MLIFMRATVVVEAVAVAVALFWSNPQVMRRRRMFLRRSCAVHGCTTPQFLRFQRQLEDGEVLPFVDRHRIGIDHQAFLGESASLHKRMQIPPSTPQPFKRSPESGLLLKGASVRSIARNCPSSSLAEAQTRRRVERV